MITRNDCLLLLADISNQGVNTDAMTRLTISKNVISREVLEFINSYRPLSVKEFYEQLRHNYNNKHSKLYKNIVKEIEDTNEVLTTLSALLTQILLFSRKCENKQMFLKHSRAEEISKVLTRYFENYDITTCISLIRLIKADLKALESLH